MSELLKEIIHPELFIGLVGPVGVDLTTTTDAIFAHFKQKGYDPELIKITDLFGPIAKRFGLKSIPVKSSRHDRTIEYITRGNDIRRRFNKNEVLAAGAIAQVIARRRQKTPSNKPPKYSRKIFIIRQLKRLEEVELLRKVYGDLFFQISVYARRETRLQFLANEIRRDFAVSEGKTPESMAIELTTMDENQSTEAHGQRVAKVFHVADFIVNTENVGSSVPDQVGRFCELIFGSNLLSPTKLEYGMHAAKTAALRTLDLSRQVGAAIFTQDGTIIAEGSNEVPKGTGGQYWCDESDIDAREFRSNEDSNEEFKKVGAHELYSLAVAPYPDAQSFAEFVERDDVQGSQVMDALEYGRIVHAEMAALMDAARFGKIVQDATLFSTTFPCHMCAKHIVAAGLKKVVYLEPYPKSLVPRLHSDSIQIDGANRGHHSSFPYVEFSHFWGVTPRRYVELFERGKRKNDKNQVKTYIEGEPRPVVRSFHAHYAAIEIQVVKEAMKLFKNIADDLKL